MIKGKTLVVYDFYWGEVMEGLSLKVWMYHLLPLQTQRSFSLWMQLPDSDLSKLAGCAFYESHFWTYLGHSVDLHVRDKPPVLQTSLDSARQNSFVLGVQESSSLLTPQSFVWDFWTSGSPGCWPCWNLAVYHQKAGKCETIFLFFCESFSHNSVKIQHSLLASKHLVSAGAEEAADCYYRAFNWGI